MNSNEEKSRAAIAEQAGEWFVANDEGSLDARDSAALATWFKTSPVHIEEFLGVSAVVRDLKQARTDPQYSLEAILARARTEDEEPVQRRWPRETEAELVTTVIGHKRGTMPSPSQCYLAALAIFIPGAIALVLAGVVQTPLPPWLVPLAGAGATLVFAGRGIAGYVPAWRARHPREPFASLDRRYYSPLCLLLAAGFIALLAME